MRPPVFLLKTHRIPHRDPPDAKRRRRTHVSRMSASRGHGQNPAPPQSGTSIGTQSLLIRLGPVPGHFLNPMRQSRRPQVGARMDDFSADEIQPDDNTCSRKRRILMRSNRSALNSIWLTFFVPFSVAFRSQSRTSVHRTSPSEFRITSITVAIIRLSCSRNCISSCSTSGKRID